MADKNIRLKSNTGDLLFPQTKDDLILNKKIKEETITSNAFELADDNGNVILKIDEDGNLESKKFDSTQVQDKLPTTSTAGKVLTSTSTSGVVSWEDSTGGVSSFGGKTGDITVNSNHLSMVDNELNVTNLPVENGSTLTGNALEVADSNGNVAMQITNEGHIQAKAFDSSALKALAKKDTITTDYITDITATTLVASDIPSLDATKITTGTFPDARIASAATWNSKQSALTPTNGVTISDGNIGLDSSKFVVENDEVIVKFQKTDDQAYLALGDTGSASMSSIGAYGDDESYVQVTPTKVDIGSDVEVYIQSDDAKLSVMSNYNSTNTTFIGQQADSVTLIAPTSTTGVFDSINLVGPDSPFVSTVGEGAHVGKLNSSSGALTYSAPTADTNISPKKYVDERVQANPTDTGTTTLSKLKVGDTTYNLSAGTSYTAGQNIDLTNNVITAKGNGIGYIDSVSTITQSQAGGRLSEYCVVPPADRPVFLNRVAENYLAISELAGAIVVVSTSDGSSVTTYNYTLPSTEGTTGNIICHKITSDGEDYGYCYIFTNLPSWTAMESKCLIASFSKTGYIDEEYISGTVNKTGYYTGNTQLNENYNYIPCVWVSSITLANGNKFQVAHEIPQQFLGIDGVIDTSTWGGDGIYKDDYGYICTRKVVNGYNFTFASGSTHLYETGIDDKALTDLITVDNTLSSIYTDMSQYRLFCSATIQNYGIGYGFLDYDGQGNGNYTRQYLPALYNGTIFVPKEGSTTGEGKYVHAELTINITVSSGEVTENNNTLVADIIDTVSGTNDGTNWSTLTVNGVTKNIPAPTTYTGTNGVTVNGSNIGLDSSKFTVGTSTVLQQAGTDDTINKLTISGTGVELNKVTTDGDPISGVYASGSSAGIRFNGGDTSPTALVSVADNLAYMRAGDALISATSADYNSISNTADYVQTLANTDIEGKFDALMVVGQNSSDEVTEGVHVGVYTQQTTSLAYQAPTQDTHVAPKKYVDDQVATRQATLPTTSTAGKVLTSTSTAGTVEWADAQGGVTSFGGQTGAITVDSAHLSMTGNQLGVTNLGVEPSSVSTSNALELSDTNGNVALQIDADGEIQTKGFDSSALGDLAERDTITTEYITDISAVGLIASDIPSLPLTKISDVSVTASNVNSSVNLLTNNSATAGQVLIANGSGGASWGPVTVGTHLYKHTLNIINETAQESFELTILSVNENAIVNILGFMSVCLDSLKISFVSESDGYIRDISTIDITSDYIALLYLYESAGVCQPTINRIDMSHVLTFNDTVTAL